MESKLVYHIDRRGLFEQLVVGSRIQACSVKNLFYSNLLTGENVSIHGDYYLNFTGVRCKDAKLCSSATWEVFAELIRLKAFPQFGSRYSALFGFENPNDLKWFIEEQNDSRSREWKVYLLEVSEYVQKDMTQLGISANEKVVEGDPNTYYDNLLIKHCYDYWKGIYTSNPRVETLIYGEATVRNIIEYNQFASQTYY